MENKIINKNGIIEVEGSEEFVSKELDKLSQKLKKLQEKHGRR